MKLRATMLALPLAAGLALAQSTSGAGAQTAGSQTSGSSGQQQSGQPQSGQQADRTGQTSQGAPAAGAQGAATAGTQADRTGGSAGEVPQLKTMTYKGTLVDLACAGGAATTASAGAGQSDTTATAGAKTPTTSATTPATGATTATAGQSGTTAGSSTAGGSMAAGAAGTANRSAGGDCPATANSTNLGLKMDDGKTVRFDLVGNQRAQDELKNNKGWTKNLSANKPLKVKVSGVLQGDKLIVSSIH